MPEYRDAKMRMMKAAFELGQAQRELEDAQEKFQAALRKVESLESLALPTGAGRGIISH